MITNLDRLAHSKSWTAFKRMLINFAEYLQKIYGLVKVNVVVISQSNDLDKENTNRSGREKTSLRLRSQLNHGRSSVDIFVPVCYAQVCYSTVL